MKNHSDTITDRPNELLEDLNTLVAEAEKLIADTTSTSSSETLTALRSRLEAAQDRLKALYLDAKTQVVEGAKSTDTAIRENPYQSLAIVGGVALIAGLLIGGRRAAT